MSSLPSLPARRAQVGAPSVQRSQIIAAAAALFAGRGYHGTSMHDVGARVGLLKGSLYVHVANKEEMLLEIVSTISRRIQSAVEPSLAGAEDPAARLRLGIGTYVGLAVDDPDGLTVYVHEGKHLSGQPAAWYKQIRHRHMSAWRRVFADGISVGAFHQDLDVDISTRVTMSACEDAAEASGKGLPKDHLARAIADLVLGGCDRLWRGSTAAP